MLAGVVLVFEALVVLVFEAFRGTAQPFESLTFPLWHGTAGSVH
jgi:hypothetical protein